MTEFTISRRHSRCWKFTFFPLFIFSLAACSISQKAEQPVIPTRQSEATAPITSPATTSVETFKVVSWNVQTFGNVQGARAQGFSRVFPKLLDDKVRIFAAEEVARQESADVLTSWLPNHQAWRALFTDSPDSQDNGIWIRSDKASVDKQGYLFSIDGTADRAKSLHPAYMAHLAVEDFDFTLVALHLTYKAGDAAASQKEFNNMLEWLAEYLKDPKNDPDVVFVGDYNLPTRKGKMESVRAKDNKWVPLEDMIGEEEATLAKPLHLVVLVDTPTSRSQKSPRNNYDHFIMTAHAFQDLVSAERIDRSVIDDADRDLSKQVSDHYPIVATFKCRGLGIYRDNR